MKIIGIILALILVFGCISQNMPFKNETKEIETEIQNHPSITNDNLISSDGDSQVSTVTLTAAPYNGSWKFPISDYNYPFISANIHSTAYVVLNSSTLKTLDENESIWLTPLIRSGNSTLLFNAIYKNDFGSCNPKNVIIIGKSYPLSAFHNGQSFEFDDKWKVFVFEENGCKKSMIIYLDGYFGAIGENEQISLFRNDNTVLFTFKVGSPPKISIIGTRVS